LAREWEKRLVDEMVVYNSRFEMMAKA